MRAIALSQFLGAATRATSRTIRFEAAATWGARTVRAILGSGSLGRRGPVRHVLQRQLPRPVRRADVRGVRAAAQGFRPTTRFGAEAQVAPSGPPIPLGSREDAQGRALRGRLGRGRLNLDGWVSRSRRCAATSPTARALGALELPEGGA